MTDELEATKLGETKTFLDSDQNIGREDKENLLTKFSLKGTTLGGESDFEKSLKGDVDVEEKKPEILPQTDIDPEEPEETPEEPIEKDSKADVIAETKSAEDNPSEETILSEGKSISDSIADSTETQKAIAAEPVIKAEHPAEVSNVPTPKSESSRIEDMYEQALIDYNEGDVITGTVIAIEKAGIFVDINYKCEGFISNEEIGPDFTSIKAEIAEGTEIAVQILKLETKEGYTLLSKRRAEWETSWKNAYQAYKMKETVDAFVINAVKGGLVVTYNGLKGFIPASLVRRGKDEPLTNFINSTIKAQLVEVDKKRKKIILSNKVVEGRSMPVADDVIESLETGQVVSGKVTSIKDFGAFVNINGIEGLIHISELSWDRIEKVENVLNVGDDIDVFILGIDKEEKKVSLGLKQLTPDPWETVDEVYPIGKIVHGKISRLASFGAFVKLDQGLEGLIHISELSDEHVNQVDDIIAAGDEVKVKVLRVIAEEQKIGLSLRQAEIAEHLDSEEDSEDEAVPAKDEKDTAAIAETAVIADTAEPLEEDPPVAEPEEITEAEDVAKAEDVAEAEETEEEAPKKSSAKK